MKNKLLILLLVFSNGYTKDNNTTKTPENWTTESNQIYRVMVSTFQYENANYDNSNELMNFANLNNNDNLYFKAYNISMRNSNYKQAIEIVDKWIGFSKLDLSHMKILTYTLNDEIDKSFKLIIENTDKVDNINEYLKSLYQVLGGKWYEPNIMKLSEKIYNHFPNDTSWIINHYDLHRLNQEPKKAIAVLDKEIFNDTKNIKLHSLKSDLYRNELQLDKAEKVWTDLLKDFPYEQNYLLAYADFSFMTHQYEKNINIIKQITDEKIIPFSNKLLISSYTKINDTDNAEKVIDLNKATVDEQDEIYYLIAKTLLLDNHYDKSEIFLNKISNEGKLQRDKKLDLAIVNYKKSIKEGDEYFDNITNKLNLTGNEYTLQKSMTLKQAGYEDYSYRVIDDALAKEPKNKDLLYSHSLAAEVIGKSDVAIADLELLLSKEPNSVDLQNALGYTLIDSNYAIDKGVALIRKGFFAAPYEPAILDSMGWGYYKQEKYKESLKYLYFAYTEFKDIEIIGHYILALFDSKNIDKAKKIYQLEKQNLNEKELDKYIKDIKGDLD